MLELILSVGSLIVAGVSAYYSYNAGKLARKADQRADRLEHREVKGIELRKQERASSIKHLAELIVLRHKPFATNILKKDEEWIAKGRKYVTFGNADNTKKQTELLAKLDHRRKWLKESVAFAKDLYSSTMLNSMSEEQLIEKLDRLKVISENLSIEEADFERTRQEVVDHFQDIIRPTS